MIFETMWEGRKNRNYRVYFSNDISITGPDIRDLFGPLDSIAINATFAPFDRSSNLYGIIKVNETILFKKWPSCRLELIFKRSRSLGFNTRKINLMYAAAIVSVFSTNSSVFIYQ